jgi:hypothetical protein
MSRFIRLFGLLIAVLAFAGVATASAMAEEMLPLNLPQVKKAWTAKKAAGSEIKLEATAGNILTALEVKGTGKDTSDTLGEFSLTFEDVKEGTKVCTGTGDATGSVLSNGTYHYVFDSLSPLGVAVLFLTVSTGFTCEGGLPVTVEAGTVLCLILEPESSKAIHLLHCEQTKGVAKEKTWWNDAGTAQTASLKCSIFGIKSECSFLALTEVKYEEAKALELV